MRRCITDYLVQEHHELGRLLNELQEQVRVLPLARNLKETAERLQKLTREITVALRTHLEAEEQVLYPALEGHIQGITTTLDRMRHAHDAGEAAEKTFIQCVERLARNPGSRQEIMQSGRRYVQWVRSHLLEENGRLFPLVERGLDPETQKQVRRAMEELSRETTARVAEGMAGAAQA
jgi:hemerythrin-like domain-containing protein